MGLLVGDSCPHNLSACVRPSIRSELRALNEIQGATGPADAAQPQDAIEVSHVRPEAGGSWMRARAMPEPGALPAAYCALRPSASCPAAASLLHLPRRASLRRCAATPIPRAANSTPVRV